MRIFLILATSVFFFNNASASDFGIGVSIKSDEQEIYIPYKISETLRIEGMLNHEDTQSSGGFGNSRFEYKMLGAGIFTTKRSTETGTYYIGFRAGLIRSNFESDTQRADSKGYLLSPVIGYEHFIGSNFSLGADIAYIYTHWDNDDERPVIGIFESKNINKKFNKTFIARYYF